jgi:hypothetical protein
LDDLLLLLADVRREFSDAPAAALEPLARADERLRARRWRVLVSGLCSVGKSSFVCALWGDAELLPTAVRDCTQTNTLIRLPEGSEADRRILLSYLSREQAVDFATRDLSYFRLAELATEAGGLLGPLLNDLPPEERLRKAIALVRKLFADKPEQFVLHEPLTEELEKLEQFLQFIDSAEYRPGQTVDAKWEDRREHLMGNRRPDGRTLDTGKLLALKHVEMLRHTNMWKGATEGDVPAPQIVDSPWIPSYHNARRADLILAQARETDLLVILTLPQRFEPESWVLQIFRERPELAKRAVVVFNQVDTIDTTVLFAREGFAAVFKENAERLGKLGIRAENLFISCARLPFLELSAQTPAIQERTEKLRKVLARITKLAQERPADDFSRKLLRACDPADAGVVSLRGHLGKLAGGVFNGVAAEAIKAAEGLLARGAESDQRRKLAERLGILRQRISAS